MKFKVLATQAFEKELKALLKKYPSLRQEYTELVTSLESNPHQGIALGRECYKIRLAIRSKGKGKSGGARVITCVKILRKSVLLLTIFDKSKRENISDKELTRILDNTSIW